MAGVASAAKRLSPEKLKRVKELLDADDDPEIKDLAAQLATVHMPKQEVKLPLHTDTAIEAELKAIQTSDFNRIPAIVEILRILLVYRPRSAPFLAMLAQPGTPTKRARWKQYRKLDDFVRIAYGETLLDWREGCDTKTIRDRGMPMMFSSAFTCAGLFTTPTEACSFTAVQDASTSPVDLVFDCDHLISRKYVKLIVEYLKTQAPFNTSVALRHKLTQFACHLFISTTPDTNPDNNWPANCYFRCPHCDSTNKTVSGNTDHPNIMPDWAKNLAKK